MSKDLNSKQCKAVLLGRSTQIDIERLRDEGKSYVEIDSILEVPKGSSEYTINYIRGDV